MTMEMVERETGLTEEVDGWLSLTAPALATYLEASRSKYAEHGHRKMCVRIVNMYRKAHPKWALWSGSEAGRPVFITPGDALGPDEISIAEISEAMDSQDPKAALLTLLNAKKILGGGRLTNAGPLE